MKKKRMNKKRKTTEWKRWLKDGYMKMKETEGKWNSFETKKIKQRDIKIGSKNEWKIKKENLKKKGKPKEK